MSVLRLLFPRPLLTRAVFAWCIQLPQPESTSDTSGADRSRRIPNKIRISCFWQHDLKTSWAIGAPNLAQTLPAMVQGLVATVQARGLRVPCLNGFGACVGVENMAFDLSREALVIDYHIIPDEEEEPPAPGMSLDAVRIRKRLYRAVEAFLPSPRQFSWDLQLATQAPSQDTAALPWTVRAVASTEGDYISLQAHHVAVPAHHILKVKLAIERAVGSGLRLNGVHHAIEDARDLTPSADQGDAGAGDSLFRDAQSMMSDISVGSVDTVATTDSASTMSAARPSTLSRTATERSAIAEKVVLTRVRRNYIYFSSLLQEPEAKWRRSEYYSCFACIR